jgi:hypothetical protein
MKVRYEIFTTLFQNCDEYIGVMAIGNGRRCATFLEQLVPKKRVSTILDICFKILATIKK